MFGNVDVHVGTLGREVGGNDDGLVAVVAQENVLTVGVDRRVVVVDVHEVEERAFANGTLGIAELEDVGVFGTQAALGIGEVFGGRVAVVEPSAQSGDAPVVENGGASVEATIALGIGSRLAELLSGINHHCTGVYHGADD